MREGQARSSFLSLITHHLSLTTLLAVVALAGGERAALVAFAEGAGRAAADGALVGAVAGAAVAREHALDLAVRARDDVDADQLAHAPRRGRARVRGRLDRAHVAAHEDGDVAGADVLLADESDVGRLDHRVRGLDRAHEALGLDHSECFQRHSLLSSLLCLNRLYARV